MDTWQTAPATSPAHRFRRSSPGGRCTAQATRAEVAAVALGLQLAVLYAPRAPAIATGGLPVDKLVHIAVFALPTTALIKAGVPRRWVIGLMSAHAPLSELIQGSLLTDRSTERADTLADLAGVLLGTLLTRRPTRVRERVGRGSRFIGCDFGNVPGNLGPTPGARHDGVKPRRWRGAGPS